MFKRCRGVFWDTLIKTTSLSASLLHGKDVMPASLKSAENIVDSCRWGRDAPFGRLRGARWLCHSSLRGTCHAASSFLASAPLAASELRGLNQRIPHGVPGRIRTPGLLIRSQTLYPAELRARIAGYNAMPSPLFAMVRAELGHSLPASSGFRK